MCAVQEHTVHANFDTPGSSSKHLSEYLHQTKYFDTHQLNFYLHLLVEVGFLIVPLSVSLRQMWKGHKFRTDASNKLNLFLLFVLAHCSNEWERGLGSSLCVC